MRSTPSLPSLPDPLKPGVVAPDRVQSKGKIELNSVPMLSWIVWNRTIYVYKNWFDNKKNYNCWCAIKPNETKPNLNWRWWGQTGKGLFVARRRNKPKLFRNTISNSWRRKRCLSLLIQSLINCQPRSIIVVSIAEPSKSPDSRYNLTLNSGQLIA